VWGFSFRVRRSRSPGTVHRDVRLVASLAQSAPGTLAGLR
jgi:hypothetical protein